MVIANLATDFTAYLLVGFDFFVNMYFTGKAVMLKRKLDKKQFGDKHDEKVEELLVTVQVSSFIKIFIYIG